MKSILIIGMGTLGRHLANRMAEQDNDVMIVDKDEERIEELSHCFSDAVIGDCTKDGVLRSIGVNNFDYCFVTVGEDFYAALEITSILKELGAKFVIVKAKKDRQAEFLKKIGADEVFYPEEEMAESLAIRYSTTNILDYVPLTEDYSVFEIPISPKWLGKSLKDLEIRKKYGVNVIAIKKGEELNPNVDGEYVFREGDHIVIIGKEEDAGKISAIPSKK